MTLAAALAASAALCLVFLAGLVLGRNGALNAVNGPKTGKNGYICPRCEEGGIHCPDIVGDNPDDDLPF